MSTTTNCTNWMNWSIYILFDYSNCSQLKCNEWKTIHANQCSLFVRSFAWRNSFVAWCAHQFSFPLSSLKLYNDNANEMEKLIFALAALAAGAVAASASGCCRYCHCCCWLSPLYYTFTWHLSHLRTLVEFLNRKTRMGILNAKQSSLAVWHDAVECSMASRPPRAIV